MHDEDTDILLSTQSIDGGRSSITTRCTNDGKMFSTRFILALVPSYEKVFEEIAQELQCHVLERERWPVEVLEQVEMFAMIERDDWCNVFRTKCAVASLDDILQVLFLRIQVLLQLHQP